MEQVEEKGIHDAYKIERNEFSSTRFPKNRILFNLKNHSLVQKSLISSLLIRKSYLMEDLAGLLHIDVKKLHRVYQGKDQLTETEAVELTSLFYSLFESPQG